MTVLHIQNLTLSPIRLFIIIEPLINIVSQSCAMFDRLEQFRMFNLNVLVEGSLRSIGFLAILHLTFIMALNFRGYSSNPLLSLLVRSICPIT
jgi:hypothetical protein